MNLPLALRWLSLSFTLALGVASASANAAEVLDSPRLAAPVKTIDAGDVHALERFWKEGRTMRLDRAVHGRPQIVVGDVPLSRRRHDAVGADDRQAWSSRPTAGPMNLHRLRDTDLWYRSVRMPNDARVVYSYHINMSGRLPDDPKPLGKLYEANTFADPLNPKLLESGGTRPVSSVLEMPACRLSRTSVRSTPRRADDHAPQDQERDPQEEPDVLRSTRRRAMTSEAMRSRWS